MLFIRYVRTAVKLILGQSRGLILVHPCFTLGSLNFTYGSGFFFALVSPKFLNQCESSKPIQTFLKWYTLFL